MPCSTAMPSIPGGSVRIMTAQPDGPPAAIRLGLIRIGSFLRIEITSSSIRCAGDTSRENCQFPQTRNNRQGLVRINPETGPIRSSLGKSLS